MSKFKEYTDYSIGFTTRGCFRKCPFCVNQNYDRVFLHSPLEEFYDSSRKKICLLDDNILGCGNWRQIFKELIATNKPFKYKQGMDERLLTDEKCEILFGRSRCVWRRGESIANTTKENCASVRVPRQINQSVKVASAAFTLHM